jgi:serine/threonine protein phosphatase PrpC
LDTAAEDSIDEPAVTQRDVRLDLGRGTPLIEAVGVTHPGRIRQRNEDAFEIVATHGLAMIADGLGGHAAGDIAARMAVQEVSEYVRDLDLDPTLPDLNDPSAAPRASMDHLLHAVEHANREIHFAGHRYPVCAGMGATVAALLLVRGFAICAHVGDSRIYRLRGSELSRLTEDHTRAAEYRRSQGAHANPAVTKRHENTLTRCLGARPEVAVDISCSRRAPGDVYLLCSDGLWSVVPDETIFRVLLETSELDGAAERLVAEANAAGGPDNVTAIVVRHLADQASDPETE